MSTKKKIIDIAFKYGYDSPDGFTKSFTRFHGVTPSAVRKEGAMIKSFVALKIKFSLEGGYIIADDFSEDKASKEGCIVKTIPKFTWAVFYCYGSCVKSMQETNKKIFSEWLPNCKDYEIAAGYNIEMYSDPSEYEQGILDENYYSEIWIPVKRK